jgi:uncharacterized membrane protein YphA (DoxX/SURF4 family)
MRVRRFELLAGVLLAIGFKTGYPAQAFLLISIGIQFACEPFDGQLSWIAMFTWFAIYGAGPMSLDHLAPRIERKCRAAHTAHH